MTLLRWSDLDEREQATLQTVYAFVRSRLAERQSIEWALRLGPAERAKRAAVLEAIERESNKVAEPWRTAWRLIEESWSGGSVEEQGGIGAHIAKQRLQHGDRSGAMTQLIAELVAPRLKMSARSDTTKRPRSAHDLLSISLTSGTYVDPIALGIATIEEPEFLASLALRLESSLTHGLECARRTGWDGKGQPWQIGSLYRVYHVSGGIEPDKYHKGIAPCVKLLHETVLRLASIQAPRARDFIQQWKAGEAPVYLRLWAALARNAALVPASDVAQVLTTLQDDAFWSLHSYPELTELRARRFVDLDNRSRTALTARIRRLPPRRFWHGRLEPAELLKVRTERAIEELHRIRTAGGQLSKVDIDWLSTRASAHAEVPSEIPPDHGFSLGIRAITHGARPDRSYDSIAGIERLRALEIALSTTDHRWDDNAAQRAFDWLRENNNPLLVVKDLELTPDAGAAFPTVWDKFASTHMPPSPQTPTDRNLSDEAERVLSLIQRLSDPTLQRSIDGIAQWLLNWRSYFTSAMSDLWLRLWPMAAASTNAREFVDDEPSVESSAIRPTVPESHMDMAGLNTPTGQLVYVLISACPHSVSPGDKPFDHDAGLRAMRDAILQVTGKARLIALHRLIQDLPYLMVADRAWADANLIAPLNVDDPKSLALWHAIARETRTPEVLRSIGEAMARRAADNQLSRETRQGLTFSLVVECLHAFNSDVLPAVSKSRTLQMLRSVEDEIRVHAAYAVQRFLDENASETVPAADLFRKAVAPFLRDVWPQEQSLVTPGISAVFAKIPALSKDAFSEAVATVERFLTPFECWGLYEYSLNTEDKNGGGLLLIDGPDKAKALLRLLDLTIGAAEGSIVPHELPQALDRIRSVGPRITGDRAYRRLLIAARRA